jgi:hypothetical protein
MKEIDLVQAIATWINLSYTAGQWWITVTTGMLVATYFAAKYIPAWFFVIILLLYLLTAASVISEFTQYTQLSQSYGVRLTELRAAGHVSRPEIDPYANFASINVLVNYAVFVFGSLSAAIYSFLHWRNARKG